MNIRDTFKLVTLLMFIVSCYWNVLAKESTDIIVVESPDGSIDDDGGVILTEDEDIIEIFNPTNEWQIIKSGQAIPAGLHVRIDLSTGLKEAKLIDEDDSSETDKSQVEGTEAESTIRYWSEGDREGILHSKQKYFTHDELKDAMKLFKVNQDDVQDEEAKKKVLEQFRSIEDIKENFAAMDLNMETDIEVMMKLMQQYNDTSATLKDRVTALSDLEYYVHQIDNANDLATIGGLQLVIDGLNDTEEAVRQESAFVLGSAVQSNPKVQIKAIDAGALQSLLQMLSTSPSVPLRKKAMYAISGLLRMFPYAQQKFLDLGGLSAFSNLFRETDSTVVVLKVKAVTLLHDLLVEKFNIFEYDDLEDSVHQMRKDQYSRVDLLTRMLEQNWCELVPSLLDVPDSDVQEKVLHAMEFMMDSCQHFSKDQTVFQRLVKLKLNLDHLLQEDSSDSDDSYFYDLSLLVNNIMKHVSS